MGVASERIAEYIADVSRQFATGAATEHSYRPALQRLLADSIPRATVVNEPSRIECGAPDLLVRENGAARRPIGYVEAKDIGDGDLDGNGVHREQFDRYKAELSNIVFTDYLDFHFYADGEFVAKCRVGEVAGNRIVPAAPDELERFAELLRHFAEVAPKRIASPSRLAHLMAGKARLLARAVAATLRGDDASSSLAQQFAAFRQWLVHDLDADSFADVYAQTIVYGMFAARLHDTTPEDFSRAEAASLVPRSNPLLRRLFRDLDEYIDDSIVWIIDDLVALFAASDVAEIMRNYGESNRDPLLHFYEDFLAAYNPALRKQRGVWYTPSPVVGYIVRSVDAILRRDFALSGGLADPSKTRVRVVNDNRVKKGDAKFVEREMHRVQILDPALGTGTFLAEVVRLVRSKFSGQEGLWPGYVRDHLVPRLNGFEILMASYAMAHLKLDLLLPEATERLRIFLTNSLEEFSEATGTLWAMELSNESREADFIKRDCPVMVVMGNPPYSVSSSNKGEWIQRLVADYKKGLGEKKINLDDDYIKFIRLGQHYIDRNGEGILAYISNNSFLDGITHRQMRKSLMESFDEIYILDLHGNARKKETAPDGGKDENVFDIMQGVSINIFVRRGKNFNAESQRRRERSESVGASVPLARVFHAEVFGEREAKYGFLDAHDITSVDFKELHPQAPYYFFVPKDFALQEEYEKGFSVAELMPVRNNGIKTDRDALFVDDDKDALTRRIQTLFSGSFRDDFADKYRVVDSGSYRLTERIRGKEFSPSFLQREEFRPFDSKWIYYDASLVSRPAQSVMQHMTRPNLCLSVSRQCQSDWRYVFCAEGLSDVNLIASAGLLGSGYVFPLWLYSDNLGKVERTPNLNPEIVGKIEAAVYGKQTDLLRPNGLRDSGKVSDVSREQIRLLNDTPALAYYRRFELGRTWYDIVPVEEISSLVPIPVTPDPTADRRKVKEIFRAMPPVKNLHDGRVVTFPVKVARKLFIGRGPNGLYLAHEFGEIFKVAKRAWSESAASIPGHKNHLNIGAYHHYIGKIVFDNRECYVRFTIREANAGGTRNEAHDAVASDVVVYEAEGAELSTPAPAQAENSTPFDIDIVSFSCDAVKGGNEKTNDAEASLLRRSQGEDSATFDGAMIPFPFDTVKGDKNGPFVDYKMALFLSYARYGEGRKGTPTPEDIFHYIYAVLHTPSYRERYREFLKVDFPRIPYPKSGEEFRRLASIGERLVAVHLLKDPKVRDMFSPCATFPVAGSNMVEKVAFASAGKSGESGNCGRVFINSTQYFDNVPVEAWESFVGGYQPAQKWLKDRKGRVLSPDDVLHYKSIIAALVETRRLMETLEAERQNP